MKIKILGDKLTKEDIIKEFKNQSIEFVEDGEDYVISASINKNKIIGKLGDTLYIIDPDSVIYFESDGNDTLCITDSSSTYIKEKIYQLEAILYDRGFVRISRSHVININKIKSIKPQSNMKFRLEMSNDRFVFVTRSYYYIFKDFIGI